MNTKNTILVLLLSLTCFSFAQNKVLSQKQARVHHEVLENVSNMPVKAAVESWYAPDTMWFESEAIGQFISVWTYTDQGKINTKVDMGGYRDGRWWNVQKYKFVYNEQGFVQSQFLQIFDENTEEWVNDSKIVNTYNAQNLVSFEEAFVWFKDKWNDYYRIQSKYNADGLLIERIDKDFNSESSVWENSAKNTYKYNSQKLESRWVNYFWDYANGDWGASTSADYLYTSKAKDSVIFNKVWNTSKWDNESLSCYFYDQNENAMLRVGYIWKNDKWNFLEKDTMSYTPANQMESWTNYFYNVTEYAPIARREYQYNGDGYLSQLTYLRWDFDSTLWDFEMKNTLAYDEFGNAIFGNNYKWKDTAWVLGDGMIPFYYNKGKSMQYWPVTTVKSSYVDVARKSDIEELKSTLTSIVYPNPASDQVTIRLQGFTGEVQVQLTDLCGRSLSSSFYQAQGNSIQTELNLSTFPKGIYLIHIQSSTDQKLTKKLVIK
ncbi:MAG: T9SS type A sorting domain-containing protein [Bacteroidales bacterium]